MVVAEKFLVYVVFPSGSNLQFFLKDLIKLTTLPRKTEKKKRSKSNLLYKDTICIDTVLKPRRSRFEK